MKNASHAAHVAMPVQVSVQNVLLLAAHVLHVARSVA
jgi:hypothetical protein